MKKTIWILATALFIFCMALSTIAQEPTKKQSRPHQPYLFSELGVSLFNSLPNGQYDKLLLGVGANVLHRFSKVDRPVKFSAGLEYRYLQHYLDKKRRIHKYGFVYTKLHYKYHSLSLPFRVDVVIDKKGRFSADIRGYAHLYLVVHEKGLRSGGRNYDIKNEPYSETNTDFDGHLGMYFGLNYHFNCAQRKYVAHLAYDRATMEKFDIDYMLIGSRIVVGISLELR